jgi:hypothetical protein
MNKRNSKRSGAEGSFNLQALESRRLLSGDIGCVLEPYMPAAETALEAEASNNDHGGGAPSGGGRALPVRATADNW